MSDKKYHVFRVPMYIWESYMVESKENGFKTATQLAQEVLYERVKARINVGKIVRIQHFKPETAPKPTATPVSKPTATPVSTPAQPSEQKKIKVEIKPINKIYSILTGDYIDKDTNPEEYAAIDFFYKECINHPANSWDQAKNSRIKLMYLTNTDPNEEQKLFKAVEQCKRYCANAKQIDITTFAMSKLFHEEPPFDKKMYG